MRPQQGVREEEERDRKSREGGRDKREKDLWRDTHNFELFDGLLTDMHPSGFLHFHQAQVLQRRMGGGGRIKHCPY